MFTSISCFSNSETCFTFSSIKGFLIFANSLIISSFSTFFSIFFLFSFSTTLLFRSLEGCCSVSCLVSTFLNFLSGIGTASEFVVLTLSCFFSGTGIFFDFNKSISSFWLSCFTCFFCSFLTSFGGACSERSFLLSFFASLIIFAAFGAYGIFVFSDIWISSTDTIGSTSKGFFATNGKANIVANSIVKWKVMENKIPYEKLFNSFFNVLIEIFLSNFISLYMVRISKQL